MKKERTNFASKAGMIAATVGSAVGLGNVWRYPFMKRIYVYGLLIAASLGCGTLASVAQTRTDNPIYNGHPVAVDHSDNTRDVKAENFNEYLTGANNDDAESCRLLAICYQHGIGTEQNIKDAFKWFGKAIAIGDDEALYDMGVIYRDGYFAQQDYEEAAYWFRKAAQHNHPLAQLNIGRLFEEGNGVLPDLRIAAENYWRAAEQDVPEAQYRYAEMCRDGRGIPKDMKKARYWFDRAAKHNYSDAAVQAAKLK